MYELLGDVVTAVGRVTAAIADDDVGVSLPVAVGHVGVRGRRGGVSHSSSRNHALFIVNMRENTV